MSWGTYEKEGRMNGVRAVCVSVKGGEVGPFRLEGLKDFWPLVTFRWCGDPRL